MDKVNNKNYEIEDTQKGKYLIFSIDHEEYGIEIKHVIEIICIQEITEVPNMSNYIRGVINLRGKIIPVMDVRLRFNKEFREYDDRTCNVVISIRDISIGLIVDRVMEVVDINDAAIAAPPNIISGIKNKYIKGIATDNDKVRLLLDCNKLINYEEIGN